MEQAELMLAVAASAGRSQHIQTTIGFLFVVSFFGLWLSFMAFAIVAIRAQLRSGPHSWDDFVYSKSFMERARARNDRTVATFKALEKYFSSSRGKWHAAALLLFLTMTFVFGIMMLVENKHRLQQKELEIEQNEHA